MSTQFNLNKSYKLIIFDWEGTLAKSDGVLFPGIKETLDTLRTYNIDLAVATSMSTARVKELIAQNALQDDFTCVQTSEMGYAKPDPQMLQEILETTDLKASDAVMVGDSVFDLIMAEDAQVASIGVLTGTDTEASLKLGAEKVTILESVTDLPMYLESGKTRQCL